MALPNGPGRAHMFRLTVSFAAHVDTNPIHEDTYGGRGEGGRGLNTYNKDLVRPI